MASCFGFDVETTARKFSQWTNSRYLWKMISTDMFARSNWSLRVRWQPKQAIYLDIKFWIILRDVVTGLGSAPAETTLLSTLREGVSKGELPLGLVRVSESARG